MIISIVAVLQSLEGKCSGNVLWKCTHMYFVTASYGLQQLSLLQVNLRSKMSTVLSSS